MQCYHIHKPALTLSTTRSVESRWSLPNKDLGAGCLRNAMRERESEVLGEELLDIGALDIVGLLELDDLEDLID
jgi:hypothetical protein